MALRVQKVPGLYTKKMAGHMKSGKKKRLGESLQERGKISDQDLALVIEEQSRKAILLGELLLLSLIHI